MWADFRNARFTTVIGKKPVLVSRPGHALSDAILISLDCMGSATSGDKAVQVGLGVGLKGAGLGAGMIERFATVYVRLLLAIGILLLSLSFLLHINVLMGVKALPDGLGRVLWFATIIFNGSVTAFIKESVKWKDQIKSCPAWMRRAALTLAAYSLAVACLQVLFADGTSFFDVPVAPSGIPLGFDAISLCILYSVSYAGYLDNHEVIRATKSSLGITAVVLVIFWAFRAGYLKHPMHW